MLSNIFMNVYSIVDQLFVSNLLGTDALFAVNIVRPFLAIALAAGTMLATGGCALVSSQMGEGDSAGARRNFSFFTLFGVAVSALFCAAGIIFRAPLLRAMGADSSLYAMCEAYAIPIFLLIPFAMVSIILQIFFVAAGRPGLGFGLSIAGGLVNIILDYVLIAVIPLSVAGAAYASAAGYVLQAIIGTAFFFANRSGSLYFVRPRFDAAALLKAYGNGASEMVGMLSVSVTMIAMNVILMKLSGADGVAAAAVILSAQTILSAAYAGYVQGVASVVSFHHGASNRPEFGTLYRAALKTIASPSVMTLLCAVFLARPIALLFAKDSPHVVDLAVRGMNIFAAAFDGLQPLSLRLLHRAQRRENLSPAVPVPNARFPAASAAYPAGAAWCGRSVAVDTDGGAFGRRHVAVLFYKDEKPLSLCMRRAL